MPASWEAVGGTDHRWKSKRTAEAMLGGALTKFGMEYSLSPRLRDSRK